MHVVCGLCWGGYHLILLSVQTTESTLYLFPPFLPTNLLLDGLDLHPAQYLSHTTKQCAWHWGTLDFVLSATSPPLCNFTCMNWLQSEYMGLQQSVRFKNQSQNNLVSLPASDSCWTSLQFFFIPSADKEDQNVLPLCWRLYYFSSNYWLSLASLCDLWHPYCRNYDYSKFLFLEVLHFEGKKWDLRNWHWFPSSTFTGKHFNYKIQVSCLTLSLKQTHLR